MLATPPGPWPPWTSGDQTRCTSSRESARNVGFSHKNSANCKSVSVVRPPTGAKWLTGGREALVAMSRVCRAGGHQVLDAVEKQAIRQVVLDHRLGDLGLTGPRGRLPELET